MKRYFSIVLIALAALALGSCSKDIEEDVTLEERSLSHSVSFNVSMSDQTRTGLAFKFVPNWIKTDEKNNVHLFETNQGETIEGEDVKMEIEEGRHNEVAHFSAEFSNMTIIVNPPSGTSALTRAGDDGFYYTGIVAQKLDNKFIVPAVQYPDEETLIDPNADFLVGDGRKSYSVSQSEKAVDLYFLRPVAASRLAIMNIGQGSVIKTVKITSTAKLTGSASYDAINFSTGAVTFDANSGETTITLDYGAGVGIPAEATFYAYFISLTGAKPITSIEVTTDTHVYTKTVSKTLTFKTDDFKNIAVDMSKVTPTPVNPDQPKEQNITFHKNNGTITSDSFTLGSGTYELPTLDGVAEGATVRWSLSESNPEGVATLNHVGNTWTLTPVKAGTIKVSVTASAVEGWEATTKSFVLTVSNAATQELSFTPESLTVTLGDDEFTEPVLSGAINAVTYSIDHTNVATIDENTGKLTLVAAGTATVTATAAAGTTGGTYYAEATATYDLTVNAPASAVKYYKVDEIVAGQEYIVVSNGQALTVNGTTVGAVAVEDNDGVIETSASVALWTAAEHVEYYSGTSAAGHYTLKNGDNYLQRLSNQSAQTVTVGAVPSTGKYYVWEYDGTHLYHLSSASNTFYMGYSDGWKFNYQTPYYEASLYSTTKPLTKQTIAFVAETVQYDLNGGTGTVQAPAWSEGNEPKTTVAYASDSEVITVNATTGVVSVSSAAKVGDSATITATAEQTTEYASATATFTVVVIDSTPGVTATYNKVTNAADVEVGAKYLLVYEGTQTSSGNTKPKVYNPVLNTAGTQFAKDTTAALDVTIVNGVIESSDFNDCHFTLEAGYYLKGDKADMYIYPGTSGSSSVMLAEATASHALTIAINSGIAEIANGGRYLVWSTSSHYFSCNSDVSGQYSTGICLYKLDDGRTPQALAFTADEAEYDLGTSTWTTAVPTLSGNKTSPLTWSSSDEDVATVDASGTVTAVAKGTATISVTAPADETYKSGYASFTVTVFNSNVPTYYKADAIVAGEQYLIVSNGHALRNNNNSIATVSTPVDANGQIKYDAPTDVLWTATDDGTGFMLKNGSSYLNIRSSSLTIRTSTSSQSAYNYWTYNAEASQLVINGTYLYYNNNTFALSSTAQNAALYTTTPPKTPQSLSYTPAVASYNLYTKQWSESMPTLGGDYHTTVTYESSDDAVVEVVAGVLTPKAVGSATITATAPADATYAEATATCTITVTDSTPVDPSSAYYQKITSSSEIVQDGVYLIVNEENSKLFKPILNSDNTRFETTNNAVGVTITDGKIASSSDIDACRVVLKNQDGTSLKFAMYVPSVGYYLMVYKNEGWNNNVSFAADQEDAGYRCTYSIASAGVVSITRTSGHTLRYSNSNSRFEDGSDANNIALYKLVGDGGSTPEPPTPTTSTYTRISGQSELVTGTYLVVSVNNQNKVLKGGTGDNSDRGAVVDATASPMSMSGNTITITGDASVCEVYEYVITRTDNSVTLHNSNLGYLKHDRPSNGGNSTTYIGFENAVSASSTFNVNTNPGTNNSGEDAVFLEVSNYSGEYLYYNTSGYFKIGGSGKPDTASGKYGGVFLYKKN